MHEQFDFKDTFINICNIDTKNDFFKMIVIYEGTTFF